MDLFCTYSGTVANPTLKKCDFLGTLNGLTTVTVIIVRADLLPAETVVDLEDLSCVTTT